MSFAGRRDEGPVSLMRKILGPYVHGGRVGDLEACLRERVFARAAVNELDSAAQTLLGVAAGRGDLACCDVLLEYGANPAGVPGQAHSPVELAERGPHPQIVDRLRRALCPPPAPPPVTDLREIELDFDLGFDLGLLEGEAPVVVNEPSAAVWETLRQEDKERERSAPVETDLVLDLDGFSFADVEAPLPGGLSPEVAASLRAVVEASLAEGRVRRASLVEVLRSELAEPGEERLEALVDALVARLEQAGAWSADPVWEAVDPLEVEGLGGEGWPLLIEAVDAGPGESDLDGTVPALCLDCEGLDLPIGEVLGVVDEVSADPEEAWWKKAARARARPKSASEEVLHVRLASGQAELVAAVARHLGGARGSPLVASGAVEAAGAGRISQRVGRDGRRWGPAALPSCLSPARRGGPR